MAIITGTNLAEILTSGAASDRINALGGNDTLVGNGGNDTLDGGTGTDSMKGGAGNDFYFVNVALDKVVELGAQGTDTVSSSVTYTLPVNVEKLILTGAANINGTGNTLNNTLTGNLGANRLNGLGGADTIIGGGGADTLDGGVGNDSMVGGAGNDLYFVGAALDKVVEAGGGGTDTVNSTVTHTLALNVEKLIQGGAANIAGTGNTLNNTLTGNGGNNNLKGLGGADTVNGGAGADTLDGGTGADSLVGGAGNDTLIWDTTDVKVNGGADTDTLRVTGVTALNLTAVSDTKIVDVEVINLAGTNALTLNAADVLAISSTTDTLRVDGGAGDAVIAGAGWTQIANTTINAQTYAQYTQDGATLQVDTDVDRSGILVAALDLSALDGANGFRLSGEAINDFSGRSVSTAGDVNGDGFADLLIGAWGADPHGSESGASYVVFGQANGLGANLDLSVLDGTNGFQISGEAGGDRSGWSVSAAGDVNGDGFADLLIGAYRADPNGDLSGASYVVFGQASGFGSNVDLSTLDGANGFQLSGELMNDYSGRSVSAAGDVNGDGFTDLLIGAPFADPHGGYSGATYVVFGQASGFGSNLDLSALDGANGFQLSGEVAGDLSFSGWSVSAAGDVNGDGFADLLIGAWGADPNGDGSGATYVVFGHASGFGANLDLSALDGANGFQLSGEVAGDVSGYSVSAAGDVNGDGYADLLIGAKGADPHGSYSGATYVVFGQASGFGSNVDLSALDGTNGFQLSGEAVGDRSGRSVSTAGDVNGDGFDDLLIGAYRAGPHGINSGAAYVVFGRASGFGSNLDLSALDGTNGFQLSGEVGYDFSGRLVSAAGDANGDGFADLLIGADGADPHGNGSGASYVVFGRDWNGVVDFLGTAVANTLTGTAAAEVFVAGRGNDTLTGGGGADVFRGGAGDDLIRVSSTSFFDTDGGSGTDTLALTGSGLALDLTALAGSKVTGIEAIDLTGSGNNTLTLDALEVLNLSDITNTLRVDGGAGDAVTALDEWTAAGTTVINTVTYNVYTNGAATLQVQQDVAFTDPEHPAVIGGDDTGLAIEDDIVVASGSLTVTDADDGEALFVAQTNAAGTYGDFSVDTAGAWNYDLANASVQFLGEGETETDVFTVASLDGTTHDVTITITGNNDAPVALNDSNAVDEDLSVTGSVAANDSDVDANATLSYALDGPPPAGLVLNPDGSYTFDAASYDSLVEGQTQVVTADYTVTDDVGATDGATLSVTVTGVNDPPVNTVPGAKSAALLTDIAVGGVSVADADLGGEDLTIMLSTDQGALSLGQLTGLDFAEGDGSGDGTMEFSGSAADVNAALASLVFHATGGDATISITSSDEDGGSDTDTIAVNVSASVSLSVLNGANGFRLDGVDAGDQAGCSVASAGDVNGDGYDDVIVGARNADTNVGESYVVYGGSAFGSSLSLSALDGTNGFLLNGAIADGRSGYSVASAGDVNGDGYGDLIISAPRAGGYSGEAYVVFGSPFMGSSLELSTLNGIDGFRLDGEGTDRAGCSVASAGDVNSDGYDDIIVGAKNANGTLGESYVVYGGTGFASAMDLSALNGTNGFQLNGAKISTSGNSVASAGDVNGDGYADLIIGAPIADAQAGESYVVYGGSSLGSSLSLGALDGTNGFRLDGIDGGDRSGFSVASAGDVNGDGYADLIVGATGADGASLNSGESYVVFGGSGFGSNLDLSALNGVNGFRLDGGGFNNGQSGNSVASAGDVNGDGYDDLLVAAKNAHASAYAAGESYLVFGASSFGFSSLSLTALDGTNGIRLAGIDTFDFSGTSAASAGDVNGDGYADIIIGAIYGGDPGDRGESYVVYGGDFTGAVTHAGTDAADDLAGTGAADVMVAGKGNDTLTGGGGADVFRGGEGDDRIVVSDTGFFNVDGGTGEDTLALTGSGVTLDLTALADSKLTGIEIIDIAGSGDNTLTLDAQEVLNLSGTTNTLRVDGNAGDVINAGSGWNFHSIFSEGGEQYARFFQGAATLEVDTDITHGLEFALNLSALDGTSGFQISGAVQIGLFPDFSVSDAGDVNGDGYGDVILESSGTDANGFHSGASYVVFGRAVAFGSNLDLSALDGTNGFRISGETEDDFLGQSVSSAGDVNGDGYGDLIVSTDRADPNGEYSGASYVVFGRAGAFGSNLDLSALDGANGFQISGGEGDRSGMSVSSAGDVNGDGYSDLMVGAAGSSAAGASYVVFGGTSAYLDALHGASGLDLSALDGTNGFRISGEQEFDLAALVSSAGDVNRDGYDDLVIGAPGADPHGDYSGASYVVFGRAGAFGSNLDLSALDGTNGFKISGEAIDDYSGMSVSSAGDVNGDGYDDAVIGSRRVDLPGASYVVFGRVSGFGSNLDLSALDGTNGFRISGEAAGEGFGSAVSAAGDVNGDGYDDLIVGAPIKDEAAGASYVIFGKASGFGPNVNLSALDGANGFQISGESSGDRSGSSVSSAGDMNGDGYDDLMVGAHGESPSGPPFGASYVVFGRDFTNEVTHQGSANAETLTGTAGADVIVAGRGNDTLVGGGGADVFRGGEGDDRIVVSDAGFFNVDGGSGEDTLALTGSGLTLDLTALADSKLTGIEIIDISGSGDNTLTLDALEVVNLSGTSNTLRVDGNSGDAVIAGSGWTQIGNTTIAGQTYAQYTQGGATLQMDTDADRSGIAVAELDLSALDGTNGFQTTGETNGDIAGFSVAFAGDVNGDGYDDLLVGAQSYGASNNGAAYVVFGAASGFASNLALSALDGTNGFQTTGETNGDIAGFSVASAGDVNGDGFDDFLVGAIGYGASNDGAAYVVFGKASGFASNLALSALDGTSGFQLTGETNGDQAGISVASAGDVNGDGYDDLLVGAYGYGDNGAAYVVFGAASGFTSNLALSALDGTSGFQLTGEANGDTAGRSVASAGDVNGDGFDDLLVGAPNYGASNKGAAYVVFGAASGFAAELSLSALDGTSGFQITGEANFDFAGRSVSSAGDVNGDGFDDLLVGAHGYGAYVGVAYVVFGKASGFTSNLALSGLDGTSGFQITGEATYDQAGHSVATAGDVNGDGYDDLLVGAHYYGASSNGAAYVVFGAAGGFASNLALSALDGANGFQLTGEADSNLAGYSVAPAGDVNGDGYDDLLVGAFSYGASDNGAAYVVFGRDFNDVVDFLGTAGADALAGTGAAEVFVAGRGNDTMTGGGGADVFRGGAGEDRIVASDAVFFDVDGGSGTDTLALIGPSLELDLSALANSKVTGIEIVDLDDGSGGNTLGLALGDVLDLSDTSNTLTVEGDGDDTVTVADGSWTDGGEVAGYHVYTLGAATLRIDADITSVTITLV